MTPKGGLGKGLDSLIPSGFSGASTQQVDLYAPISMIVPNPRQPRKAMDDENLSELASSIREHGILQPLIVSLNQVTGMYTLIAGERRLRAAKLAGLEKVPVILRTVNDQERLEIALIENIQRDDLSPLEAAEAYRQLADDFSVPHEEIARRVGKNRVTITNTLRLLKLSPVVLTALSKEEITEGHARALLGLPSEQGQTAALHTILAKELNVRQTEELIRMLSGEKPKKTTPAKADDNIRAIEEQLCQALGTRVNLRHGEKGGTISIHYYSDEELSTFIKMLTQT